MCHRSYRQDPETSLRNMHILGCFVLFSPFYLPSFAIRILIWFQIVEVWRSLVVLSNITMEYCGMLRVVYYLNLNISIAWIQLWTMSNLRLRGTSICLIVERLDLSSSKTSILATWTLEADMLFNLDAISEPVQLHKLECDPSYSSRSESLSSSEFEGC